MSRRLWVKTRSGRASELTRALAQTSSRARATPSRLGCKRGPNTPGWRYLRAYSTSLLGPRTVEPIGPVDDGGRHPVLGFRLQGHNCG